MSKAISQWRDRVVGFERRPARDFQANALNFRRHPNNQRDAFRGLVSEIGFAGAVLENVTTGNLIDGHLRIEEALSVDEGQLIPCVQVELSESEEKLLLASYDPIGAMAVADKETLDSLLREVSTGDSAVAQMLSDLAENNGLYFGEEKKQEDESEVAELIDRAAELQEKWQVQRGNLYRIGRHRLLCGDSTDAGDVLRLMGGAKAQMVFTDPPYGMDLDTDYSKLKGTAKSPNAKGYSYDKVAGDDKPFDFSPFQDLATPEQFWWGADYYASQLPSGGSWNVWQKRNDADAEMIGNDFELCWSKVRHKKQIVRIRWVGWDATENGERRAHPTQKPVELAVWFFHQYSKEGDLIVDYFAGSGFSLVAAEKTERVCYGMEIEPKYCAVTLERMELLGLKPELEK